MANLTLKKSSEVYIEGERIWAVSSDLASADASNDGGGAKKRRKVVKDDATQMKLPFVFASSAPVKKPANTLDAKVLDVKVRHLAACAVSAECS